MEDKTIYIATAQSRLAKQWKNSKWVWNDLVAKCAEAFYTHETIAEYKAMSKEEQSRIKDVGGFVGGYLIGGKRKNGSVKDRSLLTLDIDNANKDFFEDFELDTDFAAFIYSTHSSTPEAPRYRICALLSRPCSPEEYEALARKVAERYGLNQFDPTTFQPARLMYWPSTPKDGIYEFTCVDARPLDVDAVLGEYRNWKDASEWPRCGSEKEIREREVKQAEDPTLKAGIIGAFCRAYTIEEAIETLLPDVYSPTSTEHRYTYLNGHVSGGLVCYDNKFAYANNATDPANGHCCNAFDLVRIHKFSHLDVGSKVEDIARRPSYEAMCKFAMSDKRVIRIITSERLAEAKSDFGDLDLPEDDGVDDLTWQEGLDFDKRGEIRNTMDNLVFIFKNDPRLKDHFWHDDFSGFDIVRGSLPWKREGETWTNADEANLRVYFERRFHLTGKDRIRDAMASVLTEHRFHPIRDYLNSLSWDGVKRLERLFIDYVGAEDNELNRAITKIHFVAAVARIFKPGCKYDYCLVMVGPEGAGKSTSVTIMGGEWFNDSVTTTEGKQGMEQLRNSWLLEWAELSSIKKSEVESIKNFISRQADIYRPAYGSVVEKHPRQCVFFGTTNEEFFLKGDTGNRRFWPLTIIPELSKKSNMLEALLADRDQLWAEAVTYYRQGCKLFLPPNLEAEMRVRQRERNDNSDDPTADLLDVYLNTLLPADWKTYDLRARRAYFTDDEQIKTRGIVVRDKFCIAEFVCERLGRDMADKEYRYLARRVGKIMEGTEGWERQPTLNHVSHLYGRQKGYIRVTAQTPQEDDL